MMESQGTKQENLEKSLAVEIDGWLAQVPGVLLGRLLDRWLQEMQDRWSADSLGDSRNEEQMRGQAIFIRELRSKWNGSSLVEEMKEKGVI
jgi:hypothetical protein